MSNTTNFKIKGICDDVNACDCCGRENLKSTVAVENLETGEIKYFGSVCAMNPKKGFGFTKADLKTAQTENEKKLRRAEMKLANIKREKFSVAKEALYLAKGGTFKTVQGLPNAAPEWQNYEIPANAELMEECRKECLHMLK